MGHEAGELAYTVRVSARARYARLNVSPRDGLVVVVPLRFDLAEVPRLVAARADWVRRARARLGVAEGDLARPGPLVLPSAIELRALEECWAVTYLAVAARPGARERPGARLEVRGAPDAAHLALHRWLARRAKTGLEPWLRALGAARGVSLGAVSVRAQRTRWASCSAAGDVSLNRNLAFLPAELVTYVFVHELCHREEMNHGPRFRRLLHAAQPRAEELEHALRHAWRFVPGWAEA